MCCRQLASPVCHSSLPVAVAPHGSVYRCQRGQARCLQGALYGGAVHAANQRSQQRAAGGPTGKGELGPWASWGRDSTLE